MKRYLIILSLFLSIFSSYGFLYFGNVLPNFNTTLLSKVLGIIFEISILLSSFLLLMKYFKQKAYAIALICILPLLLLIVNIIITYGFGFKKEYSYAMDVIMSIIFIYFFIKEVNEK